LSGRPPCVRGANSPSLRWALWCPNCRPWITARDLKGRRLRHRDPQWPLQRHGDGRAFRPMLPRQVVDRLLCGSRGLEQPRAVVPQERLDGGTDLTGVVRDATRMSPYSRPSSAISPEARAARIGPPKYFISFDVPVVRDARTNQEVRGGFRAGAARHGRADEDAERGPGQVAKRRCALPPPVRWSEDAEPHLSRRVAVHRPGSARWGRGRVPGWMSCRGAPGRAGRDGGAAKGAQTGSIRPARSPVRRRLAARGRGR
jgi:hypothetical protein